MHKRTLLIEELRKLDHIYNSLLHNSKQELSDLPEGSLVINHQPNCTCFYHSTKDAQQGISREVDLIKKLARKRYLKKRHKLLDREHSIIKEMLEILAEDPAYDKIQKCVDKLAMAKLNISETTWTPQQIEANGKQSENPYKREELRYSTNGGIMVRNMAEKMWG